MGTYKYIAVPGAIHDVTRSASESLPGSNYCTPDRDHEPVMGKNVQK